jgi:LPS-assembly protein
MHHPIKLLSIYLAFATGFAWAAESASILPDSLSNQQRQVTIASLLNWKKTPGANLCNGTYGQPKRLDGTAAPSGFDQETTITSKGPNFLKLNGMSRLTNNIIVKQIGREVHADRAAIYRNKAGEITQIELTGNVHLYENGEHLVTDHLKVELPSEKLRATTVVYHLSNRKEAQRNVSESFGTARDVREDRPGVTTYEAATYSTCRPIDPTWTIQASRLELDRNQGIGTVHNGVLKIKGIPVLPLPYLEFPIDKRRRTGILAPTYAQESSDGIVGQKSISNVIFTLPLYLNLADNYDDLMTFNEWSKRGLLINNQFRYLNRYFKSNVGFDWIAHDSLANEERAYGISTVSQDTYFPASVKASYLRDLNKLTSDRWRIYSNTDLDYNDRWKANVAINAVSDAYYFRDYSETGPTPYNLLRSNFLLNYIGNHWQDSLLVESYQSIHRFDQLDYNVQTPYSRQPELTFSGFYGNWLNSPLDFSLTGQLDNFVYQDSFNTTLPQGSREHLRAALAYPIYLRGGSITPSVYADLRSYQITKNATGYEPNKSYVVPITDLDAQWTWDSPFYFLSHSMRNEFSLHAYYVYIPTVDQDSTPNFDSYLLPYNYTQLFTPNRYTGYDKLSNANQVSLGMHDGFIDAETGSELASVNIGIANAFVEPEVCLIPGCVLPENHLSPLVTDVSYALLTHWTATASAAWNLTEKNAHALNNAVAGITYNNGRQGLFSVTYSYAPELENGATTTPQSFWLPTSVSNSVNVGAQWILSDRFRVMGYLTHDFVYDRSNLGFVGIEYDACCWRIKLVYQRLWDSTQYASDGSVVKNTYQGRVLFTLELKGLGETGAVGDRGTMQSVLANLPGYDSKE